MTLAASVRDFCRRHAKGDIWVALSGGLDSRVLLDLCFVIRAEIPFQFHVIHVHHGLSPNADHWAKDCENFCREYGFDFHLVKVKLSLSSGDSLEEAAREARYQAFKSYLQPDDLLLTAHQEDDQAETLLLQLMRGAGVKGLAAMPLVKPFASGLHGRPLLTISRQELLNYANERQLKWVNDESNTDRRLTRNFIRHEVIPVLKTRWPALERVLARSASHCAEADELLDEAAVEKLQAVQGSVPGALSAAKLRQMSAAWQRLLLRKWIGERGFKLPDSVKMAAILSTVLKSAWDRNPSVTWAGAAIRRHRDDIHLVGDAAASAPLAGIGLRENVGEVTIRYRIPGESVEIAARGKVSLKNLFQEWRVPAWERGSLPLVFCDNKLIQVPGYFIDPAYFF